MFSKLIESLFICAGAGLVTQIFIDAVINLAALLVTGRGYRTTMLVGAPFAGSFAGSGISKMLELTMPTSFWFVFACGLAGGLAAWIYMQLRDRFFLWLNS